ncbi:MAG: spore coat polysaccharide biosynthesis protein SpsC [Candidatus Binatia bacterium]|nr:MAG: spore coat polysaccharide biosynthesis protein SpsC [Candidatus Binatia bacterium]
MARPAIPVFRPWFGEEEAAAVRETLLGGWVGSGPKTREFERRFAEFVGAPCAVGVNSCTAALYLSLRAAGVEGREVVTTPLTFVATNHAILAAGGVPVFADVEPETLNIDPVDVERKIGPRTRAVVVVHFAGHPCRMAELCEITERRGLVLVEDCAHAVGARYRGRHVGNFGRYGCFSFQAVKNLSTGDGGMITLSDPEEAERLRRVAWLGIDRGSWERAGARRAWEYDVTELGLKFQMNDIAAAIGLVQLGKLREANERRRILARRYDEGFRDLRSVLETPVVEPDTEPAWHTYVVRLAREEWRDSLIEFLAEEGISATVHYIPTHHFRFYRPYRTPLEVADRIWLRLVSLPLYPGLREPEQDRVIEAVHDFFRAV